METLNFKYGNCYCQSILYRIIIVIIITMQLRTSQLFWLVLVFVIKASMIVNYLDYKVNNINSAFIQF